MDCRLVSISSAPPSASRHSYGLLSPTRSKPGHADHPRRRRSAIMNVFICSYFHLVIWDICSLDHLVISSADTPRARHQENIEPNAALRVNRDRHNQVEPMV